MYEGTEHEQRIPFVNTLIYADSNNNHHTAVGADWVDVAEFTLRDFSIPEQGNTETATSYFENNSFSNEGWGIGPETAGLSWNNCGPAEQLVTGGNPDGYITHTEYCGSTLISNGSWYFVAPAKFRGNKSSLFGKRLNFDLKSSYTSFGVGFIRGFAVLSSGDKHIFVRTFVYAAPDEAWTHYSIPLSTNLLSNPWRVSTSKFLSSSEQATDIDIKEVLANLTDLRILGDYGKDATTGLDNVVLGAD